MLIPEATMTLKQPGLDNPNFREEQDQLPSRNQTRFCNHSAGTVSLRGDC